MKRTILTALAVGFALAACGDDDPIGPGDTASVTLAFSTATTATAQADELEITGNNGTLLITDVQLVVAEYELEGDDDACEAFADDDDCAEFEAPPFLLDLPLTGGEIVVATDEVPVGTYSELEFEIEDLDEDDDDRPLTRQRIADIRTELQTRFPGFPEDASMVVTGTFTPTGGTPQPFTVFFDADIEVELDLVPPLVIEEGGAASRTITVNLDPVLFFRTAAGEAIDLSAFDGQTLEFEAEIEQGFEVEWDLDDD